MIRNACPGGESLWHPPEGLADHLGYTTEGFIEDVLDCLHLPIRAVARRNGRTEQKVRRAFYMFGLTLDALVPPRAAPFMAIDSSRFSDGVRALIISWRAFRASA